MQEIVVIDGEIELENTLDGEVELEAITDLDPEVVLSAGGGVTPSGTIEITENGTYNVTEYASADVDVQGGITPTGTKQININSNGTTTEDVTSYASAEINVNVPASAVDTGTKNINSNGTHDVVGYASANVNVPNSYSASDEGKVVSNGALVAQTSDTVTENGVVDTTLIDELTVNVPTGGGGISVDDIATNTAPSGSVILSNSVTRISTFAFYYKPIASIVAPAVTRIDGNAFGYSRITELTDASLPAVTTLDTSACENMTNLLKIYLKSITTFNKQTVFRGCGALKVARFPYATGGTASNIFQNCYALTVLDAGSVTSLAANFANNARALSTLILRSTTLVSMANASALNGTALRGYNSGSGTVYIPKALYDHLGDGTALDYQSATNWSTVYGEGHLTFAQLEGSQYENTDWDDSSFLQ